MDTDLIQVPESADSAQVAQPALSDYNAQVFNELEGPDRAYAELKLANGEDAIHTSIRDAFARHNMENKFGITLLHRHFKMDESERLVAVCDTSTPWGPDAYNSHPLGEVLPQAFIFKSPFTIIPGPFEYAFITTKSLGSVIRFEAATKSFLEEIGSLLFSLGLSQYLGLRVHPGSALKTQKLEFTVDRANININISDVSCKSIPTSWFYYQGPSDGPGPKTLKCYCHSHCTKGKDGHQTLSHTHT